MSEVLPKLKSDRLWALLAFLALVVVNSVYGLDLTESQMSDALYATIAFILGKSVRGTVGGSVLTGLVKNAIPTVGDKLPKIEGPSEDSPE